MRAAVLVVVCGCSFQLAEPGGEPATSCDAPASFADGKTPTTTIHVSADAASGGDGSEARPFRRITDAMPLAAGTQVVLAAGVHPRESLNDLEGTAENPIWIEGPAIGPRARFEDPMFGLQLVRPRYVVVRHLDIAIGNSGLVADDGGSRSDPVAHHLEIDDVQVSNVQTAFKLSGVTDVNLHHSSATSILHGVRFLGVHRGVIAHMNVAGSAVAGIEVLAGSTEIEISHNRIASTNETVRIGGTSDEAEFRPLLQPAGNYEASQIRVFNNIIVGGGTLVVCSACTSSLVASNYLKGNAGTVHVARVEGHGPIAGNTFVPAGGLRMVNNAIEVINTPQLSIGDNADGTTCAFSHNLWLATSSVASSIPALPTVELGGIYGVPSGYNDDGKLCAGAAQRAGVVLPEVPGTLDGSCRPDPPSIGPSEPTGDC